MSQNPFAISFGKTPMTFIPRFQATETVVSSFSQDPPSNQAYIIVGVRGSGKTVLLNRIQAHFSEDSNWIVMEVNPNRDILQAIAAQLYSNRLLQTIFLHAKLDLSFLGIGVSIENGYKIFDVETAIQEMLSIIKKQGKKVLFCIDEVSNTKDMKVFASSFQIMLRQDLPVYLIMTGVYQNIHQLQDEKNLTFLYRAPKIYLTPLNFTAVREEYKKALNISEEQAEHMAKVVRGYSFGFQVLGYLAYERKPKKLEIILPEFDQYLSEFVYDKIWSELSPTDMKVLIAIAKTKDGKVADVRSITGFKSNLFEIYRKRLKGKGLIDTSVYGYVSFTLPRFTEYVKIQEKIGAFQ